MARPIQMANCRSQSRQLPLEESEYRRDPVTLQEVCPPLLRNSEHTREIRCGIYIQ